MAGNSNLKPLRVALVAIGIWIIWDFLPALAWAVVVAIAIWPLFERMRHVDPEITRVLKESVGTD